MIGVEVPTCQSFPVEFVSCASWSGFVAVFLVIFSVRALQLLMQ